MWGNILHYGRVGKYFAKLSLQQGMEYKLNLLGWLISNPIQFLLGFATIRFVVENFGTLAGWDYSQLAFLYGIAVISHGISVILFIQTWYMGWIVVGGEFDLMLTRPLSVLFQFLFYDINLVGVTDTIPGLMVFFYGCYKVNFVWSFGNTVAMLLVIAGAVLIRGGTYMMLGSISFWTNSPDRFADFTTTLIDRVSHYPLTMYPRIIQIVFTFLLPFGFISFFPASAFLGADNGFSFPAQVVWVCPAVGLAVFLLACLVFSRGLKRYNSAGS